MGFRHRYDPFLFLWQYPTPDPFRHRRLFLKRQDTAPLQEVTPVVVGRLRQSQGFEHLRLVDPRFLQLAQHLQALLGFHSVMPVPSKPTRLFLSRLFSSDASASKRWYCSIFFRRPKTSSSVAFRLLSPINLALPPSMNDL